MRAVCRAQSFLRSSRDPDSPSPPYREVLPGLATLPGSMLIAILVAVSEERAAVRQVEAAFWQGPTAAEAHIFDCRSRRRNTELSLPPTTWVGRRAYTKYIQIPDYPIFGLLWPASFALRPVLSSLFPEFMIVRSSNGSAPGRPLASHRPLSPRPWGDRSRSSQNMRAVSAGST